MWIHVSIPLSTILSLILTINFVSKTDSYDIREATISDIDNLVEVHYTSWHFTHDTVLNSRYVSKYTREHIKKHWGKFFTKQKFDNRFVLVAEHHEKIIGLLSAGPIKIYKNELGPEKDLSHSIHDAEIYKFYIMPSHHNKGVGRRLLQQALNYLVSNKFRNVVVRVNIQSEKANQFYVHMGFNKFLAIEHNEAPYALYDLSLNALLD